MKKCRECNITEDESTFKPKANVCKKCHSSYMKEYRKKNRTKISQQVQKWKNDNRERYRDSNRKRYNNGGKVLQKRNYEKTFKCFISKQISQIYSKSRKPGPRDPKDPIRRMVDIDYDFLLDLWDKQDGKCALTNIPMVHKFHQLNAVSIDRINSSKGHVKGNIQLVCKAINLMKNTHTNEEVFQFLEVIKNGQSS
jgi:hypothetical protein